MKCSVGAFTFLFALSTDRDEWGSIQNSYQKGGSVESESLQSEFLAFLGRKLYSQLSQIQIFPNARPLEYFYPITNKSIIRQCGLNGVATKNTFKMSITTM